MQKEFEKYLEKGTGKVNMKKCAELAQSFSSNGILERGKNSIKIDLCYGFPGEASWVKIRVNPHININPEELNEIVNLYLKKNNFGAGVIIDSNASKNILEWKFKLIYLNKH